MGVTLYVLIALQLYFLLMTFTVERVYCHEKIVEGDTRFLVQETVSFCQNNNKLFLDRPEWMVKATCIHSYLFSIGYLLTIAIALSNSFKKFAVPLLLFVGAKMNAICFYHYMEFTSKTPPQNLVPYLSVELPYVFSMLLIVYNVHKNLNKESNKTTEKKVH